MKEPAAKPKNTETSATATSTLKFDTTGAASVKMDLDTTATSTVKVDAIESTAIKPTTNIAVKPPTDFVDKSALSITIKPSTSITTLNEPLKDKTNVDQASGRKLSAKNEFMSNIHSIQDEKKMIEPEKDEPIAPINVGKKRKMLEGIMAEPEGVKKLPSGRIVSNSVKSPNAIESTFGPTAIYNLPKCLCRKCRDVVDTDTWKVKICSSVFCNALMLSTATILKIFIYQSLPNLCLEINQLDHCTNKYLT